MGAETEAGAEHPEPLTFGRPLLTTACQTWHTISKLPNCILCSAPIASSSSTTFDSLLSSNCLTVVNYGVDSPVLVSCGIFRRCCRQSWNWIRYLGPVCRVGSLVKNLWSGFNCMPASPVANLNSRVDVCLMLYISTHCCCPRGNLLSSRILEDYFTRPHSCPCFGGLAASTVVL